VKITDEWKYIMRTTDKYRTVKKWELTKLHLMIDKLYKENDNLKIRVIKLTKRIKTLENTPIQSWDGILH